jgi:hypothetical protein
LLVNAKTFPHAIPQHQKDAIRDLQDIRNEEYGHIHHMLLEEDQFDDLAERIIDILYLLNRDILNDREVQDLLNGSLPEQVLLAKQAALERLVNWKTNHCPTSLRAINFIDAALEMAQDYSSQLERIYTRSTMTATVSTFSTSTMQSLQRDAKLVLTLYPWDQHFTLLAKTSIKFGARWLMEKVLGLKEGGGEAQE